MAALTRLDPFNELQRLTEQMFRGWTGGEAARTFAPPVDIYEDDKAIYVRAELPGVKAADVQIDVENNVLTIRGERRLEREDQREGYHRIESVYGTFTRSFALPESVDTDNVEADISDGVLTVKIPKKPEVAPKRIEVKGKGAKGEPVGQMGKGQAQAAQPQGEMKAQPAQTSTEGPTKTEGQAKAEAQKK